jgi:hypothetical protein
MKKLLIPAVFFTLIPFYIHAQTDTDKLLKDIKGKVDEIIIKSEGKEYNFKGDDAESLFQAMKQDDIFKQFKFFENDDHFFSSDSLIKKFFNRFKEKNKNDNFIDITIRNDNPDSLDNDLIIEKRIVANDDNGKKSVKVITKENGQEKIQVYEGKAADQYLEKTGNESFRDIEPSNNKDLNDRKIEKIIIEEKQKAETK